MIRKSFMTILTVFFAAVSLVQADTFKNKTTGETFTGFRTQKANGGKTLVYDSTQKKLVPLDLGEFEITMDDNGRRNSVALVSLTDPDSLLSEAISKAISDAIVKASNMGHRLIILKIDNPGGRGEYMKEIATTISKTDNCKIVSFIPGDQFGGAHSAAAIVALATNKIYLSPTATLSAVAPLPVSWGQSSADFLKTYSPDTLASYGGFGATLAKNDNCAVLARGLLDKTLSLVEVVDPQGKHSIIEKDLRQSDQTVVKTLCEGASYSSSDNNGTNKTTEDMHRRALNLTVQEAIRMGIAEKAANSIQDVMMDMSVSDAELIYSQGIDNIIKQFSNAKKNIGQSLARISYMENRTEELDNQLKSIEVQLRTTPVTRARSRDEIRYNNRQNTERFPNNYNYYYNQDLNNQNITLPSNNYPNTQNQTSYTYDPTRRNQNQMTQSKNTDITIYNEAPAQVEQIKYEMSVILNNLIPEYRRTVSLAKKWDGALPPELTVIILQKKLDEAIFLLDGLRYR